MVDLPRSITLKPTSRQGPPVTLECTALLRFLPGNRKVLAATWQDRPVVVKLFLHPIKARFHAKREWLGLTQLHERRVKAPALLFRGTSKEYGWAVVTERIGEGVTVRDLWDRTGKPQARAQMLATVASELAGQHEKGVLQRDLHLGNFLLYQQTVFVLDPSQMRFLSGPVGRKQALGQLASLASVLPEEDEQSIRCLCEAYARARGWELTTKDMNLLHRKALAARKRNMKSALKKCLRTNKRHERISKGPHRAVLSRDLFDATDFSELVKNLDRTMQQGEYLKNGNTCFVSKVSFAGKEVVVKRYNHKGLLHSLRQTFKRSRARRSWLNANRLTLLKIPTPKPVAFIEQYKMGVLWQSYLLTKHAPGQKLWDLLRDENLDQHRRLEMSEQLKGLLDKLARHRITHGDLKHTNVLITDHGPVLTDLDALRVHRTNWGYPRRSARDRAHLEQIHTPGV